MKTITYYICIRSFKLGISQQASTQRKKDQGPHREGKASLDQNKQ